MLGCQASVNADANVSGKDARAESDADVNGSASAEGEGKGEMTRSALAPSGAATTTSASVTNPMPDKGSPSCQCLSVALGGSRNGGMLWSAVPPDIDEGAQLVIALSSDGQACKDEPKNSLGASYWGYRLSGNDVVVLVEAARGGRPLTSGAIIPKPVGPGQVYVAPAFKKLPYGRPLEGKGLCKIGNPGQVRSAAFTELEVGSNAPARSSGTAKRGESGAGADQTQTEDTPTTIEMPSN
jgi:hypothetical protein